MTDIVFNGLSYDEKTKCLSSVTNGKFCANEWGQVVCNRDFCNQWEKYDMDCVGEQCVLKALNNNKFCSMGDEIDCTKIRNDPGVEFRLSSYQSLGHGTVPDCGPGTVMADRGPASGKCVPDCGPGTVMADRGPESGKCVPDTLQYQSWKQIQDA